MPVVSVAIAQVMRPPALFQTCMYEVSCNCFDLCCRYSKSEEAVDLMGKFKSLLDPNQILNPYKLLPVKNRYYKPQEHHHATAVVQ